MRRSSRFLSLAQVAVTLLLLHAHLFSFISASNIADLSMPVSNSKFKKGNFDVVNETSDPRQTVLTFVNGIYHSLSECQDIAKEIQKIFKEDVRPFYNPTTGKWLADLTHAGMDLMRRPDDHALARDLAKHLRKALRDVGREGRILHMAHSGGAIITYLAAKHHLTPAERSRIDVATFGGGRSITRKYFSGRVVNYYSRNDPLLLVDGRASELSKLAARITSNSSICEVRDKKHNTTFVFLEGLAKNSVMDHSMNGPTYLKAMALEAGQFRKRMNKVYSISSMHGFWFRLARKRVARASGLHYFWDEITPSIRGARKATARLTSFRGFFSGKGKTQEATSSSSNNLLVNASAIRTHTTKGAEDAFVTDDDETVISRDEYSIRRLKEPPALLVQLQSSENGTGGDRVDGEDGDSKAVVVQEVGSAQVSQVSVRDDHSTRNKNQTESSAVSSDGEGGGGAPQRRSSFSFGWSAWFSTSTSSSRKQDKAGEVVAEDERRSMEDTRTNNADSDRSAATPVVDEESGARSTSVAQSGDHLQVFSVSDDDSREVRHTTEATRLNEADLDVDVVNESDAADLVPVTEEAAAPHDDDAPAAPEEEEGKTMTRGLRSESDTTEDKNTSTGTGTDSSSNGTRSWSDWISSLFKSP